MVMGQGPGQGQGPMSEWFSKMTGLPPPDQLYAELQRANRNMEMMAPYLQKISSAVEGLSASDIRSLANAIQGVKLQDLNATLNKFYSRIWGR